MNLKANKMDISASPNIESKIMNVCPVSQECPVIMKKKKISGHQKIFLGSLKVFHIMMLANFW